MAGLRAYFAAHAWGNASLDDLMGALATASGRDLAAWTHGWLDTAGADTLSLEPVGEGFLLRASGPDGGAPRPHRLDIGVYDRSDGSLVRQEPVRLEVAGATTQVPGGFPAAGLLLVNDGDLTYASVRPDRDSLADLLASAGELPTATARAVAVGTVWDMLMTGDLPAADVVRCITGVLAGETAESVIEPFLGMAVQAAELWAPAAEREALLDVVAQACLALSEHGGARRLVALRSLARTAVTDEQLATLRAAAGKDDVDLQWRTLTRLAALGRLDRDAVEALREGDPDPDAWVRALGVEAAAPDTDHKQAAWRAAVEERRVPIGSLFSLAASFWQPAQGEVLQPFAEQYLAALPELGSAGMIPAMATAAAMFPLVGVDGGFVDRVVAAAKSDQVSPVVARRVLERADQLQRMLTARG